MDLNIQDFNIVPVQERYYGVSKDILKIEKAIGEYRKKYLPETLDDIFIKPKILKGCFTDPKLFNIANSIKDAFGFKAVSLKIEPAKQANAFTIPLFCNAVKDAIDYSAGHPRFKKEVEMSCVITICTPLIFNPDMTDAEVTALLLHEIGHNFQYDILKDTVKTKMSFNILIVTKYMLKTYCDIMAVPNEILPFATKTQRITAAAAALVKMTVSLCKEGTSHKMRNVEIEEFAKKIETNAKFKREEEKKAMEQATKYKMSPKEIKRSRTKEDNIYVALFPLIIALGAASSVICIAEFFGEVAAGAVVSFAKNLIKNRLGIKLLTKNAYYNNEKIADSFAAELGYGVQLASGIDKMYRSMEYNVPGAKQSSQTMANIEKITYLPINLLSNLFDEHPSTNIRYELYYKELINDLEKGYFDPEMKADLEKNISDIKDYMEVSEKSKNVINNSDNPDAERSVITGVIDLIVSSSMGFVSGVKEAISKIEPHFFTTTPNISDSKEEARNRALEKSNYIDTSKLK